MATLHSLEQRCGPEPRVVWRTHRRGPGGGAVQPLLISRPFAHPIPVLLLPTETQNGGCASPINDDVKLSALAAMGQLLAMLKPGEGLPSQLPIPMYLPFSMTMAYAVCALRASFPDMTGTTPLERFLGMIGHTFATLNWLPPYGVRPLESVVGETCSGQNAATGEYFQCEHLSMNPPDTMVCVCSPEKGITIASASVR